VVSAKERVCQSHTFMGVHPHELVCSIVDLFLEHLKLIPLRCVLLRCLDSVLEHEVLLDDKGEPVLHLHAEERAALAALN
jgi:hypothetical protein